MFELITTFKTAQEALKQTIEAQLAELKTLVSHAPKVATPTPVHNAVQEPQGNQHRFILVTPISICRVDAQEGLQEGAAHLDLAVLPSEMLRTLQAQITEEFNEREQLVKEENIELRQERDQAENNYRNTAARAAQWKQDEVSLKRVVVELCSKLPDIKLETDTSILDNVQKVVVHAQALVVRMGIVEAEYKAKIEDMEKRDSSEQLKAAAKEISGKIVQHIQDTTHLLETATSSWLGIEQIDAVEEVHKEICQVEVDIAKLKEEITGLTPIQQMIQSGKSEKLQIQLQKLCEEETEFMQVTQPWQDELANLAHQVETKLPEFRETQDIVGKLFTEQVTKESLEQVKGSVTEMAGAHNKLQDVYTDGTTRQTRSQRSVRSISDVQQQVVWG